MTANKIILSNDVILTDNLGITLTNKNKRQFIIGLDEINDFLVTLYESNEIVKNLIENNNKYQPSSTPWAYQEKPYRDIAKIITLDKYPVINPLIGSQTKGLFSAIGLYVNYTLKRENEEALPFDKHSLQDFLIKKKPVHFSFISICEFCANYEEKNKAYLANSEEAINTKNHLKIISKYLEDKFLEMNVSVDYSKGVGKFPRIPYICILPKGQSVSDGVYVAICFGRSGNGMVAGAAESISNRKGLKTVKRVKTNDFIDVNGTSQQTKYNDSFVNPVDFHIKNFNMEKIYSHLDQSLLICFRHLGLKGPSQKKDLVVHDFYDSLNSSKLIYEEKLSYRLISSLLTKPFVILTGLSGSGKTKLAEAFSLWISEDNNQYCMVSVGADWTNREPILGYPNALEPGKYVKPDCGALDLILSAGQDSERPYFLILDEMNMSHVERYFADFLSAMESTDRTISLHPEGSEWKDCDVPATVNLPKNLFVIGTVNIDETTYMFSPKVLDRANVIEFRVSETEMQSFFENPAPLNMEALRGKGAAMGMDFAARANASVEPKSDLKETLMPFFRELHKAGAEFGYRTAYEISRFAVLYEEMTADLRDPDDETTALLNRNAVVDAAVMQKLLPKVHGSRNKIEPILKLLAKLCMTDQEIEPFLETTASADIRYPLSYEKLQRMHRRVMSDGFTSYAEA